MNDRLSTFPSPLTRDFIQASDAVLAAPELAQCRRHGVLGKAVTTFAIGGPLRRLIEVPDTERLELLIDRCHSYGIHFRMLGAGSNLLVPDEGVEEIVTVLGKDFSLVESMPDGTVIAGARVSLPTLSRRTAHEGLSGLEFASGIPGTVGGGIRMNAGAHGGELADVVTAVEILSPGRGRETLSIADLRPTYRAMSLPEDATVVRAFFQLLLQNSAVCEEKRRTALAYRKSTQPLTVPSAGSTFRNPNTHSSPAGKLLDDIGLKGSRCGGAVVSPVHANWIVNPDRAASARDVLDLIDTCRTRVQAACAVQLHPELVVWHSKNRRHDERR